VSAVVAAVAPELGLEDRAWVAEATAFSGYAGPDGHDEWVTERCGLGHALLRTSPNDEKEPVTLDGEIWLSADARLDDRRELVGDLRSRGCDVSLTDSDAELVLHAYSAWGEQCVGHLAGDFAFALWDGRAGRLLCARDQLGTTPLHYAQVGERLFVASVVDAPQLHPAVGDDLDETALADFLVTGRYIDQRATAFASVRQVPPAHLLVWSDGEVRLRRYWRLPEWEDLTRLGRSDDYVARFRDLLDAAVADRMTDDRVTVHLSGGMDSPSVAASAHAALQARGAPPGAMRAVTAVLGGESGDREGDYASLVADSLDLPVDLVVGASLMPIDPLATAHTRTPEPTPYRRTEYEYKLAALPARHARVALSGLGGDPLLMFVPWYWIEWLAHGRVPRVARALSEPVRLFHQRPRPGVRTTLGHARRRIADRAARLPDWLQADLAARTCLADRARESVRRSASSFDVRSLVGDPLWSRLFTWGDPSFSRLPVKFRHPLVDLRLLRYVLTLPPDPWLVNKLILREATHGRLPEEIRRRPKAPLVRSPLPGATPAAMERLATLVRQAPGMDRFVDRDRLAAAVTAPGAAADYRIDRELSFALGLAHWLRHRRRPTVGNSYPSAVAGDPPG
jgi:asparagine synthase (glutamine-hydrolysing)